MPAEFAAILPISLAAFVVSAWLVGRLRSYALRRNLVDEVGERSSHAVATPRGGGLAIVAVSLVLVAIAPLVAALPPVWALALGAGGALVAGVGWIDDHGHVAARYRLIAHFSAAVALVAVAGPVPLDVIGLGFPALEWLLSTIMVVWLINLFNFMDGIDGIASAEAITAWTGLAFVLVILGRDASGTAAIAVLLAAAVGGFLLWNLPPAKIFMGDVASGFLGLVSGALVLFAARIGVEYAAAILILLAVFVVDATVTVIRRALRRQPVYEAHRSHAYQKLSMRWRSHGRTTATVVAINLGVLLPLAFLVASGQIAPVVGVMAGYLPLAVLALLAGAGGE